MKRRDFCLLAAALCAGCGRGVWGDPAEDYSALDDAGKWSTFDLSAVSPSARGFLGGLFDGRYVYFVPYNNGEPQGNVTRYDTTRGFTSLDAWTVFDVRAVHPQAKEFAGATFDGRYVYLVPLHGVVPRYDTRAPFEVASSWSTFDLGGAGLLTKGLSTAVFDGRRINFSPFGDAFGTYDGVAASYDTQGDFDAPTSWSTIDLASVDAQAIGLTSSLFDGRYLQYGPSSGTRAVFARHDPRRPFASPADWSTFDVATVDGNSHAVNGSAFDGRYAYYAPLSDGRVIRCDTMGSFWAADSWTIFDVTAVDARAAGFAGVAFDGRFAYFAPWGTTKAGSVLARVDTQAPFTSPAAWSTFDLAGVDPGAVGFSGAVFDGRYVYLVPNQTDSGASGLVVRFDARVPRSLPASAQASSY